MESIIDAYHWDKLDSPILRYRNNDSINAFGRWSTKQRNRLQVISSQIVSSTAANDDRYFKDEPEQLELDF